MDVIRSGHTLEKIWVIQNFPFHLHPSQPSHVKVVQGPQESQRKIFYMQNLPSSLKKKKKNISSGSNFLEKILEIIDYASYLWQWQDSSPSLNDHLNSEHMLRHDRGLEQPNKHRSKFLTKYSVTPKQLGGTLVYIQFIN